MKKLFSILLAVSLTMTFAVSVSAATNYTNEVVVEAGKGTPVVDGVVNEGEWFGAKELTVTLDDPVVNQYGEYQGNWASEKPDGDYSASMYFMWDEEALYIMDKRVDDYVSLAGDGTQPWSGSDGNLIFLQTIDSGAEGNENAWSHHIFYIAGNGSDNYGGTAWVRVNNGSSNVQETVKRDQIAISTAAIDGGWVAEIKVPWTVFAEEIPNFVPAANAEIGFSMVPIDTDADGDFSQISWFKKSDGVAGGYDYGGWATLKLCKGPAPAITAPAAANNGVSAAELLKTADVYINYEGDTITNVNGGVNVITKGEVPLIESGYGQAGHIVGGTGYLTLEDYLTEGDSFSFSSWIYCNVVGANPVIAGNKYWGSGANPGWLILARNLSVASEDIRLNLNIDGGARFDADFSTEEMPIEVITHQATGFQSLCGQWIHIVTVVDRDAEEASLYINGQNMYTTSFAENAYGTAPLYDTANSYPVNIGQDGAGGANGVDPNFFDVIYDDTALFSKALSADEVAALYSYDSTVPVVEAPEADAPVVSNPAVTAPQTFDFGVVAVVTAVVSLAGYALSKKK